jgi:hypothetical protein
MVSIEIIALVLTGLSITVSILYYSSVLRNSNKTQQMQLETRQAQLFMNVYSTFTSYEFKKQWNTVMHVWQWDDETEFNSKYGYENPIEFTKIDVVATFFEGIGVLVKRGLVDISFVDDLMSAHIVTSWEKFKPMIENWRERDNNPQLSEWWEYLYNEVKPIMEDQHPEIVGKRIGRL